MVAPYKLNLKLQRQLLKNARKTLQLDLAHNESQNQPNFGKN